MTKRYSESEKLGKIGVLKTDLIITDKLGWIFREQPILDVGIDAILEEVINNEPTGKFIAVQIKSGEGNFHLKQNSLTYYPSNIHYNYWTNLNIPIIFVAYLPKEDKCYWKIINKKTLKKTKKSWKLKISKYDELINSKNRLSNLVQKIDTPNIFSKIYQQEADFTDEPHILLESKISIDNVTNLMSEEDKKLKEFRKKFSNYLETKLSNDKAVISYVKSASRGLIFQSNRIIFEMNLFSNIFSKELFVVEKIIYANKINNIKLNQTFKNSLAIIETKFQKLIKSIEKQKSIPDSITESAISLYPNQKELKESLTERIDMMTNEFETAHKLIVKLLKLCN